MIKNFARLGATMTQSDCLYIYRGWGIERIRSSIIMFEKSLYSIVLITVWKDLTGGNWSLFDRRSTLWKCTCLVSWGEIEEFISNCGKTLLGTRNNVVWIFQYIDLTWLYVRKSFKYQYNENSLTSRFVDLYTFLLPSI